MSAPGPILAVVLAFAVLAAFLAELHSLLRWNARAVLRCQLDMRLTEPGELVTLSYRLGNTAPWPLTTVSVTFRFDSAVEILEEDRTEGAGNDARSIYTVDTSLGPHRLCRGSVRLRFRERGYHALGRAYVETGDFLGLRTVIRAFDLPLSMVCTAKSVEDRAELEPLGGFLGDVSVRRFILEDPSMILGCREYSGVEPMKDISWLQTARTGRLMVKQHDYTVDTDVAVLVDVEAVKKPLAERCLSLVRTVCDELEQRRIPYVVLSNGDLHSGPKGSGRLHNFEIQRRIGMARFVRRLGFGHVLAHCVADSARRGYIVVAPGQSRELTAGLTRLRAASGMPICVLLGKEEETDA